RDHSGRLRVGAHRAAGAAAGRSTTLMQRFAICNETFGDWSWDRTCAFVAETGYQGIEIAPFTFAESVTDVSAAQRRETARVAADQGLEIAGLHWLLASPKGLHIHTRDEALRRRTVEYLRALVHFAGDVGAKV